jgi:hypothetical protein
MTNHVARLYAVAASLLALFLAWAVIAAAPWQTKAPAVATAQDPMAAALAAYKHRLRRDAKLVDRILERRTNQAASAAPRVRIVTTSPPVATTRTS